MIAVFHSAGDITKKRGIAKAIERAQAVNKGSRVSSYFTTGSRAYISKDGHTTFATIYPAGIRIAQCVVTAPDLGERETRELAHGRAVTYLQAPGYRDALIKVNGWDPAVVQRLADHELFRSSDVIADNRFHRAELLGPAELIPDAWMTGSCALGSVPDCVASLRRFRAAGADEIVTYGSTPRQNAGLAQAWATEREGALR